jgi:hypothetical protein
LGLEIETCAPQGDPRDPAKHVEKGATRETGTRRSPLSDLATVIAATVVLTVTSSGRIGWDESAVVLIPLAILFLVLRNRRQRASSEAGA